MQFVFNAAPIYSLEVAGTSARFPVNRIFCVGRNYAAHAREMGKDPDREPPFFFMKPSNAAELTSSWSPSTSTRWRIKPGMGGWRRVGRNLRPGLKIANRLFRSLRRVRAAGSVQRLGELRRGRSQPA